MYTFALLGGGAELALERLLAELDGSVGVVRAGDATEDLTPERRPTRADGSVAGGVDTEYVFGDDDVTRRTDESLSIGDVFDRLAPDHDYAIVLDAAETDLPAIVAGTPDEYESERTLVAVDDPATLDVDAVVDAVHETEPYETLESLVAEVKRSPDAEYAGAIATFTGRVRTKEDEDDERTHHLEFEKYEEVADRRMRRIETELEARDGVLEVRLHHRTGRIASGEDIVFVVVLAGHRTEAFQTVADGINRLKDEVPLFKKEVTDAETFWVHERR